MAQFRSWWMFKYAREQFSLDCSNIVQMFKPEKMTRPIKRNYNSISLCENMRTWGCKLSSTQGRTNQWNLGIGVRGNGETDRKSGGQRTVERKGVKERDISSPYLSHCSLWDSFSSLFGSVESHYSFWGRLPTCDSLAPQLDPKALCTKQMSNDLYGYLKNQNCRI